ncbi:MAG: hypothetical protein F4Y68_20480 [Boseongicola sp. SB0665_bin_10]|nr:hypothetical protein [Boseongicola sp. SB0665_bin_10]
MPEPAPDLVDLFMQAAPRALLVCKAGFLAMIALWTGTECLLGTLLVGRVKSPVALFRIALGGQRRSGRPDGSVGGWLRRVREGGARHRELHAGDRWMADAAC